MADGRPSLRSFITASIVGAGLALLLDPRQGGRRRTMLRDKLFSLTRRSSSGVSAVAQQAAGQATGLVRETVPHPRDNPNPDDQTLKDRIESEVFRDPAIPKGNININVADGIVVLRGELETAADIDNVIAKVRAVPDVQRVESYLHLPGTPAPNKASVLHVS